MTFYAAQNRDGMWKLFGLPGHEFELTRQCITPSRKEAEGYVGHEVYVFELVIREHHPARGNRLQEVPRMNLFDDCVSV